MRKFLSLALVALVVIGMTVTPASAEIELTLYNNKVEISEALQNIAKIYSDKTDGVTVKVESVGGGADYSGNLTAKHTAD